MVAFLAPLAVAAAGVGGGILGSLIGGGKKAEYHAPKEHYAPIHAPVETISKVYAPTYQYQIESPEAVMVSKKDITAKARGEADITPSRIEKTAEGVDMTTIAIIGVVGLVAYGLVSKK